VNPVFVAIDTRDLERAIDLAQAVRGIAGGVKLGLEFFSAQGPRGVRAIAELGLPVFLDLKLHDIPNTVSKAVEALAPLQPQILTVHASGGRAMLEAAKNAAPSTTKIVGVTVLTSLDSDDLAAAGVQGSPAEQVDRLARLAREAGIDGIVCSGAEVSQARKAWPEGFFVVPGVRPAGSETGDQKRVVTPARAVADGASVLVIGRPITGALNPRQAMMDIAATLEQTPAQARI
jgi:orotidine-5'-phosphate decarboxylase